MRFWKSLWDDESGAVATEYVILVGLIAIVLIASITAFRKQLAAYLGSIMNGLSSNPPTPVDETTTTPTPVK